MRHSFKILLIGCAILITVFGLSRELYSRHSSDSEVINVPINTESTPTPTPRVASERALKVAAEVLLYASEADRDYYTEKYASESGKLVDAIEGMAFFLEDNTKSLIYAETLVEKIKSAKERPVVNYQAPDVELPKYISTPELPTRCTSNTYGNSTYTNCY